ncbi:MAG: DUF2164 domain-containing protein [Pseudomonadales bacterium]
MAKIEFSKAERQAIVAGLKLYFREELDQDIAQFDAEFLLDYLCESLGPYFYNRGLYDAQAVIESRLEGIAEAIYEIEVPTDASR